MPLDKIGRHASRPRQYALERLGYDLEYDEDDEYLNMRNKRIIQVAQPVNDVDVVNKKFLEERLDKIVDKLNSHIKKAESNIQTANKVIVEVTSDLEALFKHLNIKKLS